MLEHYFVKPSTIDKIRGSWLGSQIESYVEWTLQSLILRTQVLALIFARRNPIMPR